MASKKGYSRLYAAGSNHCEPSDLDSPVLRADGSGDNRGRLIHVILYLLLLASNIVFITLYYQSSSQFHERDADCIRPQLISSPARSALQYTKKRLWRDIDGPNPFTGSPRPEFDQAWKQMIEPMTIKVSADELAGFAAGDTTLEFRNGSGYIAEMAAYHELHCIKRIRRHLHFERYYGEVTEDERIREEAHIDHCLEYWREAAMCRGDITLGTFFWRDGVPTSRVYTDHECVNWEALDSWARNRMVNMADYSQFV